MNFPESFLIKNNPPLFHAWVPTWLGVVTLVLLLIPGALIGGAYSSNLNEMSSGMGILSEHIMFANFATAIGMMMIGPFVFPLVSRYRFRDLLLGGFALLLLLSGICASTQSVTVLVWGSFLLGMVRVIVILTTIFCVAEGVIGIKIMYVLTPPDGTSPKQIEEMNLSRGMALNLLYMFFLSVGQAGNYLTSYMAYHFRWQYSYLVMMGMVAIGMIAVLMIFVPDRDRERSPLQCPSIWHTVPCSLMFLSLSYILTYGKTYDWFSDVRIIVAGGIVLVSTGIFMLQQARSRETFVDFKAFTIPGVVLALVCFFLVMVLSSSSSLVSAIMGLGLKLDSFTSAGIGNWQYAGFVAGAIINIILIKKGCHTRWILALGFSFISLSAMVLYFQFQTMIAYWQMIIPTILRSTGMMMIYAYCGYFGILKLNNAGKQIGTWIFVMLMFRSVTGPMAGASLYSNGIYHRSQNYIERFAAHTDVTSEASNTFKRTQMGMMYQGKSYDEATQMASLSTKGNVQIQATLVALKEISGWTIWVGIGCMSFVLLFPYKRELKPKKVR